MTVYIFITWVVLSTKRQLESSNLLCSLPCSTLLFSSLVCSTLFCSTLGLRVIL